MPRFDNPAFQQLADSLAPGLRASSARSFDLVFEDDLPVTVSLHPNGRDVGVDVWCADVAALAGVPRRAVVQALLQLNATAQAGRPFCVGLDPRDFVLVHGRQPLAALEGDAFADWLAWLVDQSRRIRALVRTLALQDARLAFTLTARHQAAGG